MKIGKKTLSITVGLLLALSSLPLIDASSTYALAPQSQLARPSNPEILDIMKLTAEIISITRGPGAANLFDIRRNTAHELPAVQVHIDDIGLDTAPAEINRPGEVLTYNFREKRPISDGQSQYLFIPCAIGSPHSEEDDMRYYLCRVKFLEGGQYEFQFFTINDLKGCSMDSVLQDSALLAELTRKTRGSGFATGTERFVEQQDVDRIIREAILTTNPVKQAKRLEIDPIAFSYALEFLSDPLGINNKALRKEVVNLFELGQVMIIPGLKKPHAGGIGIYLPDDEKYLNPWTLVHEIFAKCGFGDGENKTLEELYDGFIAARKAGRKYDISKLNYDERHLIEKAKTASFIHRMDDPLNVDYYRYASGVTGPASTGFYRPKMVTAARPGEVTKRLGTLPWDETLIERMQGSHNWYLGIDSSTQSVTFLVIDGDTKEIIWRWQEKFDDPKYDEFGTKEGVLPHPDAPERYHTDPLMLAAALENGLAKLSLDFDSLDWDMSNIKAIAGAGQQHGTVYYRKNAIEVLGGLKSEWSLYVQLRAGNVFSRLTAPIWQDGTTGEEVRDEERVAGGPTELRKKTGSAGTRRFSLAQVLKFFKEHRSAYDNTGNILNIAAYNLSLLAGSVDVPLDPAEGAGTNAMHLTKKTWWNSFLIKLERQFPGLELRSKLNPIKPSDYVIRNKISNYWVERYGFSPETKLVNWTGDNPSSLTGMGIVKKDGRVVISLGTSYTIFNFLNKKDLRKALESPIGHVFGEPTGKYMKLVCFQNGALTLEKIRDKYIKEEEARTWLIENNKNSDPTDEEISAAKWKIFEEVLKDAKKTKPGNDGAMMIAQHKTEDVVRIALPAKSYTLNLDLDKADRAQIFRAAVEGQAYFLKYIAEEVGIPVGEILLTGGVSNNQAVRQIIADVFGVTVNVLTVSDSVALGSAIRAAKVDKNISWTEAAAKLTEIDKTKTTTHKAGNVTIYEEYYPEYISLIKEAMAKAGAEGKAEAQYLTYDPEVAKKEGIEKARILKAVQIHEQHFGQKPTSASIGPGRINILGEHIDYAGGHVLPVALKGVNVIATVSKNDDKKIRIFSPRFGKCEVGTDWLKLISPSMDQGIEAVPVEWAWARYPLGVIRQLMIQFPDADFGMNIAYDGNVPIGGGLSSSAAVETATFTAISDQLKLSVDKVEAAKLCRRAEHWTGRHCGIMDQFVSFHGKEGKAIKLNCNTLEYEEVDLSFLTEAGYRIVAVDSGVSKADEAWQRYNTRVNVELQAAVEFFKEKSAQSAAFHGVNIKEVVDIAPNLTPELLLSIRDEIIKRTFQIDVKGEKRTASGKKVYDRLAHVVSEETRVKQLAEIAQKGNELAARARKGEKNASRALQDLVKKFGQVINEGHRSIDELYEVSSEELNFLVGTARKYGAVGARMTGAGLGGCTINIVKKKDLEMFTKGVAEEYKDKFDKTPDITVSEAGNGVEVIDLKKIAGGEEGRSLPNPEGDEQPTSAPAPTPDAGGITKSDIDVAYVKAAEYAIESKPVFFVQQGFATPEECKEILGKDFKNAQFVQFNPERLETLPTLMRMHEGPKAIITFGISFDTIIKVFDKASSWDVLDDAIPVSFSKEGMDEINRDAARKRAFQREVLTIAAIERSLPRDKYRDTRGYLVLQTMLKELLPAGIRVDEYLANLYNPNPITRFGYILSNLLKPIVPLDIEALRFIVETFLMAA